jgi:phosphate transport system protein
MLEKALEDLQNKVRKAAFLAEGMVNKAEKALEERKGELAREVIEKDEEELDLLDLEITEDVIRIFARYQPKARDLRMTLAIFNISRYLERAGDHAVNIAEYTLDLVDKPLVKPLIDMPRMAQIASEMLKDSINAFMRGDAEEALRVIERDDEVDNLLEQVRRELITYMVSDSSTINRGLKLTSIARNLERIADLATNIAEEAVFLEKGKIIKHTKP